MKIAHQERNRDCTVNVYPVLDDDGPTVYYMQTTLGRGTGSLTEPRVTAEVYALRHVACGALMPEMRSGRGYSHWNPAEPNGAPANALPVPRFMATRRAAINARGQWARGVVTMSNGQDRDGEYWEEFDVVDTGRKVTDLEIVVFNLVEKKEPLPESDYCGNCGEAAPGCGGLFRGDGSACKFHGKAKS